MQVEVLQATANLLCTGFIIPLLNRKPQPFHSVCMHIRTHTHTHMHTHMHTHTHTHANAQTHTHTHAHTRTHATHTHHNTPHHNTPHHTTPQTHNTAAYYLGNVAAGFTVTVEKDMGGLS